MRGGSFWTLAGTVAQGGFRLLLNILIGRFGGPALLGQTSGILALAQLATLAGATSISGALTRYLAASHVDPSIPASAVVRSLRRRMLLWFGFIALAGAALAAATGMLEGREAIVSLVIAGSLAVYQFAKAYLLGTARYRKASALEVVTALGGVVVGVGLVCSGIRDENLLWPVAATAIAFALAAGVPRGHRQSAPNLMREVDIFVLLGVAGTLVSAGFLQGSMILAAHGLGGAEAGEYASAFTLATPLSLVTMSVGLVLFPTFSRTPKGTPAFAALLDRTATGMAVLLVPLFSVIMLLAPEMMLIVWGDRLGDAPVVMALLVCAVMFGGLGMPASQALTSTGVRGMATSVKTGATGLAVGLLVWTAALPALGARGIALGFLVGTLITSAAPLVIMCRRSDRAWSPHLVRGWGVGLVVAGASVMADYAAVSASTRAVLAVLVAVGWLFANRRHVLLLARR